ncbi:hypothetical protein D9758_000302 [Tetrapyrgos nigripes]|uniref:Uncharacterized protein n=1 Tax=Tetrapyrgos nigripes TaxID=182062 RepID=A0A8H5LZ94_9AGAR|nr:hypothetical protein D9758_000302 [Tetrapyrgos nigripes]
MSSPSQVGKLTIFVFTITLLSFVVESQLTQYVQTTLSYSQPYFIFYLVHSCFMLAFPCHLLYLALTTGRPTSTYLKSLKLAVIDHFSPRRSVGSLEAAQFPWYRFAFLIIAVTAAVTVPALLWFIAMTLSSVTDVTAIWNTNAFFAYVLSVKVFGLKWETRKLVVYGGSTAEEAPPSSEAASHPHSPSEPSMPLLGDLLTFIASIGYAGYQVHYKKYAALAEPEDTIDDHYEPLPDPEHPPNASTDDALPPLPYGLYSNMMTFAIGFCTMVLLWIPLPILHWFNVEPFSLPNDLKTTGAILCIIVSGSIFNAGFMILLASLGPIITSVGGLLTIVLVFISDVVLGNTDALTIWTVVGSATIVAAFGVLAYDILYKR